MPPPPETTHDLPLLARGLFQEALQAVALARVLPEHVACRHGELRIGSQMYPLNQFRELVVVAAGKAAGAMTSGMLSLLSGEPVPPLRGVCVGPQPWPASPDVRIRYLVGEHPVPGEGSRRAAEAVLALLASCDRDSLVLVLLSGGASSMMEKPLDPAVTDAEMTALHRALVHSGLPIAEMNVVRKHLSATKGGRLAVAARGATLCTLIVSDVPPAALEVVGSGPTLPDPSTTDDCRRLLTRAGAGLVLPPRLREHLLSPDLPETPKAGHPAFARATSLQLLSSEDLCRAAQQRAAVLPFVAVVDNSCDEWPYLAAADYLLQRLAELAATHGRVCLLSAGELAVPLPPVHGVGGRNQQFVLACAHRAALPGLRWCVLSAGSDGADGNSPAAGALADGTTLGRAAARGLSPAHALASFDTYPLFAALGDAVITGPTGNNLRDLRILLAEATGGRETAP